jgi:hypothetical protein
MQWNLLKLETLEGGAERITSLLHPSHEGILIQSFPANRRPVNCRFDPSSLPQYVQIPKWLSFPGRSTTANAREHCRSVASASPCNSVVVQHYQCRLFFITFCKFLCKISKIMGPTIKAKQMLKLGSLTDESLIDDASWNQLTLINGGWLYQNVWNIMSSYWTSVPGPMTIAVMIRVIVSPYT